jgi:hypothetical protein
VPSRLSRLSRGASIGTAAAAVAVPLPGGTVPHPKAVQQGLQQLGAGAAAGAAGDGGDTCSMDDVRAADQGMHLQGLGASRGSSEPQTPSAGGTSGDPSSGDYQTGCSSSPDGPQQQQQRQTLLSRQSPAAAAAAAAAAAGSPSAGLATMMQGLDTKGTCGGDGTGRSPATARRAGV